MILYKNGIGYFEHQGTVHGDQAVQIDFSTGQLNDVLQSLTILDLGGGRIAGVNYNSAAPLEERLRTLQLPLGKQTNLSGFYDALRGARLEVRNGNTTITGRLLSAESRTRTNASGNMKETVELATLVSDSGDVRSVEITPAVEVRLADQDVTAEVSRYLSLLASERQQDVRRITIQTAGLGERQLYVSYISEVPVWKTTYRIVLPEKPGDQPLLQGWAIVDNTVGADWNNVELSLVAGAPQSFIQSLSQPYYARRPVVPLPENAQLTPQTHESGMETGAGSLSGAITDQTGAVIPGAQVSLTSEATGATYSAETDSNGRYIFSNIAAGNYRLQAWHPGFQNWTMSGITIAENQSASQDVTLAVGEASGEVVVSAARARSMDKFASGGVVGSLMAKSASPPPPSPAAIEDAVRQSQAAANAAALGDLFEYKLKDRVTIHKNESALVPILQTPVSAQKVSLWNASLNSPRPLRAVWLTNSSNLTLDGGSFSVLESGAFAGEGITDPIKPGEKRLLSYAVDLGVRVSAETGDEDEEPQRFTHVKISRGVMEQTVETLRETTYHVQNDDTTPRVVLIEHPIAEDSTLTKDTPKPAEQTADLYRFRLDLAPKTPATLRVGESEVNSRTFEVSDLTPDQVAVFYQGKAINAQINSALRAILEQKAQVAALDIQLKRGQQERQEIFTDQQRLRENLKALKGSAEERELTQRYVQQLSDEETRLGQLKREISDLQSKRDAAQSQLNSMIQALSFDADL